MVEGTPLLRVKALTRFEGSNPFLSANKMLKVGTRIGRGIPNHNPSHHETYAIICGWNMINRKILSFRELWALE